MAATTLNLPIIIFIISGAAALFVVSGDQPTAYDMLQRFGLPKGVLPRGVQSYQLNESDGSFEVLLAKDCEFMVQKKHLLRYRERVTGVIETGALRRLSGVSVKVLFVWVGISDAVVAGDELRFSVGPIITSVPLSEFAESPVCRGDDDGEDLAAVS